MTKHITYNGILFLHDEETYAMWGGLNGIFFLK